MGTLRGKLHVRQTAIPKPGSLTWRALSALGLILVSQAVLSAEAKQSLEERRLNVIKGSTPGIVILDLGTAKRAEPAASASGEVQVKPSNAAPAAPAAPQGTWASRWLSKLPPPSGRSLNDARRLDAPDQGIPVPSAASASQPAGLKNSP
jgi:hypothetical protein